MVHVFLKETDYSHGKRFSAVTGVMPLYTPTGLAVAGQRSLGGAWASLARLSTPEKGACILTMLLRCPLWFSFLCFAFIYSSPRSQVNVFVYLFIYYFL